jgi:hypothetical protein
MLKIGLSRQIGGSAMTPQSDTRTLYVLVSSLAGTVLSLAATWIFVAHSVQPLVA